MQKMSKKIRKKQKKYAIQRIMIKNAYFVMKNVSNYM